MRNSLSKLLNNKKLIKYFIMAVVIVGIELASFQLIYITTANYYIATVGSFAIGVILNWIFGRKVVFGASHHNVFKEFFMVLLASVVGVGIQLVVVHIAVSVMALYPLVGKIGSIAFSFFWNYWFRSKLIYNDERITR